MKNIVLKYSFPCYTWSCERDCELYLVIYMEKLV